MVPLEVNYGKRCYRSIPGFFPFQSRVVDTAVVPDFLFFSFFFVVLVSVLLLYILLVTVLVFLCPHYIVRTFQLCSYIYVRTIYMSTCIKT